jgi:hypothetical protein
MIREATLECYFYFLRRVEGDTAEATRARRAAFERELVALLTHLGHLSGQTAPIWSWQEEDNNRRASQFIGSTDWLDSALQDGCSCYAAAYIYGDVYCIQAGYCQEGQAEPDIFASLRDWGWEPSGSEDLLGSSSYLCAIAPGEDAAQAAQALAAFMGENLGNILSTRLVDFDAWVYGTPEKPSGMVLLYPDTESEAQVGRVLLNNCFPRWEVYRHKVDRQLAWCEDNFAILSTQGRALDGLLESHLLVSNKLQAQRLARQFRVYESNLETLAERQMTVETNLHNLDVVLREFGSLAEDHLLDGVEDRLWGRRQQLEETIDQAERIRHRAEAALQAIVTRLGLQHPADLLEGADDPIRGDGIIQQVRFPGALPPYEAVLPFPKIEIALGQMIGLDEADIHILQHVYRGYDRLRVLKEFHGGATCRHALLTQPVGMDGYDKALRVSKIGAALELLTERNNYRHYVGDTLPFFTAPVEWERYYAEGDLAGLSYLFIGGGGLGETMELEDYYWQAQTAQGRDRVSKTLTNLLERELGTLWYSKFHIQQECTFESEYGPDLFEHLRLQLRPESHDALWPAGTQSGNAEGYQQIAVADIPSLYPTIAPGTRLAMDGLVIRKIKNGVVKLRDAEGYGIVLRVTMSDERQDLALGSIIGLRGEVVYNRHGRMQDAVRALFGGQDTMMPGIEGEMISLPGVQGRFPNPLLIYPRLLNKKLPELRKSYVHGDLHTRNVLVDGWGIGRLIDFAEVGERHNLFDFIRLEGYLRYLTLGSITPAISLQEYIQFEESLTAATLGRCADAPTIPTLCFMYDILLDIRRIASQYLVDGTDILKVYLPALFLHCLGYLRYEQKSISHGIRLTFATACVLGREAASLI